MVEFHSLAKSPSGDESGHEKLPVGGHGDPG
jgi:hypothetical protein